MSCFGICHQQLLSNNNSQELSPKHPTTWPSSTFDTLDDLLHPDYIENKGLALTLPPPPLLPPPPRPVRPPPPRPPPPRPPLATPLASTERARKRKAQNIRISVFISKSTCRLLLSALHRLESKCQRTRVTWCAYNQSFPIESNAKSSCIKELSKSERKVQSVIIIIYMCTIYLVGCFLISLQWKDEPDTRQK